MKSFPYVMAAALCLLSGLLVSAPTPSQAQQNPSDGPQVRPLRALLIAGGCCHDYANQQKAIAEGIQARANVRVDVYWTDNSTTAPVLPLYRQLNWAEDYDVIIHDECAADIKDKTLVNRIVQVHQEIPAVHLHCAMHSFRTGTDAWFKHLGLQSSGHGPQKPIDIQFVDEPHPITETLENWTTINEELYNNVKVLGAKPLAIGKQKLDGRNPRTEEAIVAWVNESAGARSFSTTIGHNTETVQDDRYLDLVTRGLLWACDQLNDDYLQPYEGENDVTFIDKDKVKAAGDSELGQRPKNSTLVEVIASSTQQGHPAYHAIDGNADSRWCADGGSYPQSLTFRFQDAVAVEAIEIQWEFPRAYQYRVEGSTDGKQWQSLLDRSDIKQGDQGMMPIEAKGEWTWLRITGVGGQPGSWCSIREVKIKAAQLQRLWPAQFDEKEQKLIPLQANSYQSRGNVPPQAVKLTEAQEAEILRDVQVADGFEATVFAAPPMVNYPVFVAASVDGTVFVSSDGNGSLGRNPERGRVIRLRDLDGDGRADETKVFCEVDAPRGLVWDHDRLYLMHPPHLSVFIDHDGDGVADVQKTLVKNLAFGYDQRPADHTTNGLSLGVDGWLYVAGGDFGFVDAEGADGTHLQHRGGGVIRVRTDGSGLEVYSTGTRNILEVAISPQMEMFARDNTNDGGGWDVRLHHFTGNDDHGYPRLYKNFNDECIQPLADYGGGSGCGAVYIDEPGMGRWNQAPFTADWGTGALYRHTVQPAGATYQETAAPESFIRMTRPTDADVDGNSRVYCASWKGATFDWNGPDVGYLVCVRPKAFQPAAMPDFEQLSNEGLVALLDDPSYRRRMEAQRTLLRRGDHRWQELLTKGLSGRNTDRQLLQQLQEGDMELCLQSLSHSDPVVVHTAIRCLAKQQASQPCLQALRQPGDHAAVLRALAMMHSLDVIEGLIQFLPSASVDDRPLVLAALCRLYHQEGSWKGDSWGTRPDTRGPYYQPETWEASPKIESVLRKVLAEADAQQTAQLFQTMQRNRIQWDDSVSQLMALSSQDPKLTAAIIGQMVSQPQLPESGLGWIQQSLKTPLDNGSLRSVVKILGRQRDADAAEVLMQAMAVAKDEGKVVEVLPEFRNAEILDGQIDALIKLTEARQPIGQWAQAAVLTLIERKSASPEHRVKAEQALEAGWTKAAASWIQAAIMAQSHALDGRIVALAPDTDPQVLEVAAVAMQKLKIQPRVLDQTPVMGTLDMEKAHQMLVQQHGDIDLGRQVFQKANCTACHSLSKSEEQKGPFLGNIAQTYKRPELATAVLEPSKTIAQGFTTNLILTVEGQLITGFVTDEQSDQVTLRDKDGKAVVIAKDDIEQRKTATVSVMPEGLLKDLTVHEAASLLDYLEALSAGTITN